MRGSVVLSSSRRAAATGQCQLPSHNDAVETATLADTRVHLPPCTPSSWRRKAHSRCIPPL
eukprot:960724-Pleurochrysis_carterae.AAC.3